MISERKKEIKKVLDNLKRIC